MHWDLSEVKGENVIREQDPNHSIPLALGRSGGFLGPSW